jgi:hypothetical protein
MAIFKNIEVKSGKFTFHGTRIEFDGNIETEDKSLINYLQKSYYWERLDTAANRKAAELEAIDFSDI